MAEGKGQYARRTLGALCRFRRAAPALPGAARISRPLPARRCAAAQGAQHAGGAAASLGPGAGRIHRPGRILPRRRRAPPRLRVLPGAAKLYRRADRLRARHLGGARPRCRDPHPLHQRSWRLAWRARPMGQVQFLRGVGQGADDPGWSRHRTGESLRDTGQPSRRSSDRAGRDGHRRPRRGVGWTLAIRDRRRA